jgi:hypothetical protein
MFPSIAHGSMEASADGWILAAPQYFGCHNDRGKIALRWSGTQNESTPMATALK